MPGDSSNPLAPPMFDVAFSVVAVLVVVGIVSTIVVTIVRATRVARSGHNPLTLDTDLAVRALDSAALRQPKSLEQRLAELDDLRARGIISEEEHRAARAAALAG
jgi:hypothetical protein